MHALEYALGILSKRKYTEKEIRKKLEKRASENEIGQVIDRLKELQYLNDRDFAEAYLRYRSSNSPRGKWLLTREMKKKGLGKKDIEDALKDYDDREALKTLAKKQWEKLKEKPPFERKQKMFRFLTSRGFNMSDVIEVTNSLAHGIEDRYT